MSEATALTLREAAFVFGADVKDIARTVDEHSALSLVVALSGKRKVRLLGMPDLLYFQALSEVGSLLTPEGRLKLHEALLSTPTRPSVSISRFELQTTDIQAVVEKKLEALRRIKGHVEGNADDPLIKGTAVEVYRVAALFDGEASLEQIKQDYPQLSEIQIKMAVEYARIIPKKGRPYPKRSFKRALENLNLDALDEVEEH
jgi:uncharacterized protein (DUF433 family)